MPAFSDKKEASSVVFLVYVKDRICKEKVIYPFCFFQFNDVSTTDTGSSRRTLRPSITGNCSRCSGRTASFV